MKDDTIRACAENLRKERIEEKSNEYRQIYKPIIRRYASKEMQYIFSQDMKFKTWRKLWIALAETEMELGLSENGKPVITQEQIDELKAHAEDINYDVAREREKLVRHDVMMATSMHMDSSARRQQVLSI